MWKVTKTETIFLASLVEDVSCESRRRWKMFGAAAYFQDLPFEQINATFLLTVTALQLPAWIDPVNKTVHLILWTRACFGSELQCVLMSWSDVSKADTWHDSVTFTAAVTAVCQWLTHTRSAFRLIFHLSLNRKTDVLQPCTLGNKLVVMYALLTAS